VTVFLALLPLVLFGGEVLRSFTISMTFGMLVGMYSSIIVAGPILIFFGLKSRADAPEGKAVEKRADGAAV
jgi:SecD/SecF fusion protein